jgi:regulator of sigma E protease
VTPNPPPPPGPGGRRAPLPEDLAADDAALSMRSWLARNGVYLLAAVVLLGVLVYRNGIDWVWPVFLVAVGLGLVIFVHELGHFAVAKWCDVYVQTFSIGFGPALPGCRFKWGETVYKISVLPLGGYVQMLGEGSENEEDEDNPRSFKNKSVGQRMMIISAGVVMNVILACACFIAVFTHGKDRPAGEIGATDPGNQAWKAGIPSGAVLTQVGNSKPWADRPVYFTDLQRAALNSVAGQKLRIDYDVYEPIGDPNARPVHRWVELEARKGAKDDRPMIGVNPPDSTSLFPAALGKGRPFPYQAGSAAAAARQAFPWTPGDVVVQATDPDHPYQLTDLPQAADENTRELARRWYLLTGEPLRLRVRRHGAAGTEEVVTQPAQFRYGDTVVATTDPDHPEQVTELPQDPRPGKPRKDYFDLARRQQLLAGRFMVYRVKRADGGEEDLVLPPACHVSLGVRMQMGQVTGIRDNSPAVEADVHEGDILTKVVLKDAAGETKTFALGEGNPADLIDPVRLPWELRRWAYAHERVEAILTVVHTNAKGERERSTETLANPAKWDPKWRFDHETPGMPSSPWPIPELGLAYRIGTLVDEVLPDGAAAGRLQKHDVVKAIRFRQMGAKADQWTDSDWLKLDGDQWARFFEILQHVDSPEVTLKVERNGQEEELALTLRPDWTWPQADRGLLFMPDLREQKADNAAQALVMGADETLTTILDVYLQLRNLVTNRISFFKNAGGPIKIGMVAYSMASMSIWELIFFLGVISINLAVINFLPIPFLDGGHMMFMIYEKIRGRRAPESVMAPATYLGLLFLLLLMVVVFSLDIWSLFKGQH